MKEGDKRSTREEVEKMRRLYKEGLSLKEIGRRMGRDRTTILYWIKKEGDYLPQRTFFRKRLKRKKQNMNMCFQCKGSKNDLKWKKTNYCSLNCWHQSEGKQEIEGWWM